MLVSLIPLLILLTSTSWNWPLRHDLDLRLKLYLRRFSSPGRLFNVMVNLTCLPPYLPIPFQLWLQDINYFFLLLCLLHILPFIYVISYVRKSRTWHCSSNTKSPLPPCCCRLCIQQGRRRCFKLKIFLNWPPLEKLKWTVINRPTIYFDLLTSLWFDSVFLSNTLILVSGFDITVSGLMSEFKYIGAWQQKFLISDMISSKILN